MDESQHVAAGRGTSDLSLQNSTLERTLALRVGALLDAQAITYLVVGSVATVVHGEYRMTRDIDIVLNLAAHAVRALVQGLREGFTFLHRTHTAL